MTWRDWRAGEWRFLLVAMAIAVAALSSVSFFVDRMRASLQGEAAVLLGADMQVVSDRAFDQVWYDKAKTYGLSFAETRQFPTMALPEGHSITGVVESGFGRVSATWRVAACRRNERQGFRGRRNSGERDSLGGSCVVGRAGDRNR